ncbi:MAG: hypothetical protein EOP54_05680 [Sphingobacteriales bacterium]|jgi:hypothetical protein|nr:MAG: hypothetical protein EOP54_05680 [Sphingobacteriales bacterium]
MMTPDDAAKVFDTILSTPGMNEGVRIDIKITRKNVLLLHRIMECGLLNEKGSAAGITEESLQELKMLGDELLGRAGLTELREKLGVLSLPQKQQHPTP